ncbi:hypothetical protein PR048_002172 [Dryococelus australis]|uniref:Uncharacterized protein n=1 Tax=Dryococelus australis TaxID=614101 RepID=A0ABQ9IKJ0_9NEOP|nr:hypothetical protein PR048_002172 [Dryococelus australis]
MPAGSQCDDNSEQRQSMSRVRGATVVLSCMAGRGFGGDDRCVIGGRWRECRGGTIRADFKVTSGFAYLPLGFSTRRSSDRALKSLVVKAAASIPAAAVTWKWRFCQCRATSPRERKQWEDCVTVSGREWLEICLPACQLPVLGALQVALLLSFTWVGRAKSVLKPMIMKQRRNARAEETGKPRGNPSTIMHPLFKVDLGHRWNAMVGETTLLKPSSATFPNEGPRWSSGQTNHISHRRTGLVFARGIVADDATGQRVFLRRSPVFPALEFRCCSILDPLHPHRLLRPRTYLSDAHFVPSQPEVRMWSDETIVKKQRSALADGNFYVPGLNPPAISIRKPLLEIVGDLVLACYGSVPNCRSHLPPEFSSNSPTCPGAFMYSRLHSIGFTLSRPFTPQTPRPPSSRNLPSSSVLFADCRRRSSRNFSQCRVALSYKNILSHTPKWSKSPEGRRRGCDVSQVSCQLFLAAWRRTARRVYLERGEDRGESHLPQRRPAHNGTSRPRREINREKGSIVYTTYMHSGALLLDFSSGQPDFYFPWLPEVTQANSGIFVTYAMSRSYTFLFLRSTYSVCDDPSVDEKSCSHLQTQQSAIPLSRRSVHVTTRYVHDGVVEESEEAMAKERHSHSSAASRHPLASHEGEPGSIPGRVTPRFRKWKSCLAMPLVGGFSRGSPISTPLDVCIVGGEETDENHNAVVDLRLTSYRRCVRRVLHEYYKRPPDDAIVRKQRYRLVTRKHCDETSKDGDVDSRDTEMMDNYICNRRTMLPGMKSTGLNYRHPIVCLDVIGSGTIRDATGNKCNTSETMTNTSTHVPYLGLENRTRRTVSELHYGVSLLASHQGEPGSIPCRATPRFLQVGIVPGDDSDRWVFTGISSFPHPFIPALIHSHLMSPSSALKTSLLRTTQNSSLTALIKGCSILLTVCHTVTNVNLKQVLKVAARCLSTDVASPLHCLADPLQDDRSGL